MTKKYLTIFSVLISISILGCSGKEGPTGPAGAQGLQGEQGPQGPQGEIGNADITVYRFDGHDFSTNSIYSALLDIPFEELTLGKLDVYLVLHSQNFYLIPGWGPGADTSYRVYPQNQGANSYVHIRIVDGPGEEYDEVVIVFAPAGNVVDNRTSSPKIKQPDSLAEIIDYYGVKPENIIDKRTKLN